MKILFSGEMFFVLFLFAGAFKESLSFPIDLTFVFLALTAFVALKRILNKPYIQKAAVLPIAILSVLICLALAGYYYSPDFDLMTAKTARLIGLTLPAFIFAIVLLQSKESLEKFLIAIAVVASIMSVISLPAIFERGSGIGFVGFNEGNYAALARVTGFGLLVTLILCLLNPKYRSNRLVSLLAVSVVLISLIGSGGRMPVIAAGISLLIFVLLSVRISKGTLHYPKYLRTLGMAIVVLAAPVMWAYSKGFFDSFLFRMEVFLDDGGGSVLGRTDRFTASLEYFRDSFMFGNGFGSFGAMYGTTTNHDYPHNIFLELLSELGLVGALTFATLLSVAVFRTVRVWKGLPVKTDNLFITVIVVFVTSLLNSMVSGDINGNRFLFTMIAILCMLPVIFRGDCKKYSVNE